MTTGYFLNRFQIPDKNLRRSTEHVEIVPQETCVHHESMDSLRNECGKSRESTPRRASEVSSITINVPNEAAVEEIKKKLSMNK